MTCRVYLEASICSRVYTRQSDCLGFCKCLTPPCQVLRQDSTAFWKLGSATSLSQSLLVLHDIYIYIYEEISRNKLRVLDLDIRISRHI